MEARRREPYERDRIEEERLGERRGDLDRGDREARLVERPGVAAAVVPELRERDIVRWGPIWGGTLAAIGLLALLGALGAAIGLSAGTPGAVTPTAAAIWGTISLIVALFVGGYIAGRFPFVGGGLSGAAHGFLTWSTMLVLGMLLATLGFGAVMGALGMGAVPVGPGAPQPAPADGDAAGAWIPFIAMLLGLIAAVAGGYIGGSQLRGRPEFRL